MRPETKPFQSAFEIFYDTGCRPTQGGNPKDAQGVKIAGFQLAKKVNEVAVRGEMQADECQWQLGKNLYVTLGSNLRQSKFEISCVPVHVGDVAGLDSRRKGIPCHFM